MIELKEAKYENAKSDINSFYRTQGQMKLMAHFLIDILITVLEEVVVEVSKND